MDKKSVIKDQFKLSKFLGCLSLITFFFLGEEFKTISFFKVIFFFMNEFREKIIIYLK